MPHALMLGHQRCPSHAYESLPSDDNEAPTPYNYRADLKNPSIPAHRPGVSPLSRTVLVPPHRERGRCTSFVLLSLLLSLALVIGTIIGLSANYIGSGYFFPAYRAGGEGEQHIEHGVTATNGVIDLYNKVSATSENSNWVNGEMKNVSTEHHAYSPDGDKDSMSGSESKSWTPSPSTSSHYYEWELSSKSEKYPSAENMPSGSLATATHAKASSVSPSTEAIHQNLLSSGGSSLAISETGSKSTGNKDGLIPSESWYPDVNTVPKTTEESLQRNNYSSTWSSANSEYFTKSSLETSFNSFATVGNQVDTDDKSSMGFIDYMAELQNTLPVGVLLMTFVVVVIATIAVLTSIIWIVRRKTLSLRRQQHKAIDDLQSHDSSVLLQSDEDEVA